MSEQDIQKLLAVFETQGVLSNIGGVNKFRTVKDMKGTVLESEAAFNSAMDQSKNRKVPGRTFLLPLPSHCLDLIKFLLSSV